MKAEELGFLIRKARTAKGLTQAALAREAGLSRTTINQLENGTFSDLGVRKIVALLETLGLALEVRPQVRERRPNFLRMAAVTASVSYREPLSEAELLGSLLSGKVPAGKRPHFRTLLEEGRPELIKGLIDEVGQWTKPGKIEKNLDRIAKAIRSKPVP